MLPFPRPARPSPVILLVDDERDALAALESALLAHGYRVATANNGADALELAARLLPDAVITDLLMPVLDGIGLAKALRADPATAATRILLCSGLDEAGMRPLFDDYNAFMQKPCDLGALLQTLAAVLDDASDVTDSPRLAVGGAR